MNEIQITLNREIYKFYNILESYDGTVNKFFRKILELITGIDIRAHLPKYNSETFANYFIISISFYFTDNSISFIIIFYNITWLQ